MNERAPELFRLTVLGQPAGAGSKVAEPLGKRYKEARDRNGRILLKYRHDSEATAPWMEKVEQAAIHEWEGAPPIGGALWLDVAFYQVRISTHFFHRKDGDVLRPDAPAYPHQTVTHDIDKMRRAISDSLTNAGVIEDDKRIIAGGAWKLYADEPPHRACAVIRLGRMLYQTVEEAGISTPPPAGQEQL